MSPVLGTCGKETAPRFTTGFDIFLDSLRGLLKTSSLVTTYPAMFSRLKHIAVFTCLLFAAVVKLAAQDLYLGVRVNTSTNILVNTPVTYTIGLSNFTPFVPSVVLLTNTLPSTALITGVTNSQGTVTTNGNTLVFNVGAIAIGTTAVLSVKAQPTVLGYFTNQITMVSDLPAFATTNVVLQATNTAVFGDLAVSISGPRQPVFIGDWTAYGIVLTNQGPNTVTNISLTNSFPAGMKVLGVSQAYSLSGNQITFALGSLTNRGTQRFTIQAQMPTNSSTASFSVGVGAPGNQDTNLVNNTASTNVLIADYVSATLLAVTNSSQYTNRQNGLIEQKILVTNTGTTNVDSVRLVITGLTNVPVAGFTNFLFNAWGTNNGNPYVVYAAALDTVTNPSVELLLQFSVRTRAAFPLSNSQLHAFGVTPPDLTPPTAVSSSTSINFTNIALAAPDKLLVQFKSTLGKVYTIVYADNALMSNAVIAVPSIVAPANYVQWTDYGPPGTLSKPGSGSRYYKVFENP